MRKLFFTLLACALFLLASEISYAQKPSTTNVLLADSTQVLAYPLDVMAIIDGKCLGCHSPDGKSEKSRNALQWVLLQNMDPADQVAKLDEILEVLEEGSMPPEKIVAKYPRLKLNERESTRLKEWAETTLNAMIDE